MAIESHMNDPVLSGLALMRQQLEADSARRRAAMQQATDNVMQGMRARQAEQEQAAGAALADSADVRKASMDLYGPEGDQYQSEMQGGRNGGAPGQAAYEASRMASGAPRISEQYRSGVALDNSAPLREPPSGGDRDGIATSSEEVIYPPNATPGIVDAAAQQQGDDNFNASVDAYADVHAAGAQPGGARDLGDIDELAARQGIDALPPPGASPMGNAPPSGADALAAYPGFSGQAPPGPVAAPPARDPQRDAILAEMARIQGVGGGPAATAGVQPAAPVSAGSLAYPTLPKFSFEDYARVRNQPR